MTTADLVQLIFTLLSSAAFVVTGIKWFINSQIKELKAEIKEISHEIRPNGGGSIKDQVSRIEIEQINQGQAHDKMDEKLDHMYEILLEYISRSN
jgi:hypothetical protein